MCASRAGVMNSTKAKDEQEETWRNTSDLHIPEINNNILDHNKCQKKNNEQAYVRVLRV